VGENRVSEELIKRQQVSNAVAWYWHFMDGLVARFVFTARLLEINYGDGGARIRGKI
jgi:hypothetical protein